MAGRNANGEGTIYRRKDGRYEAAAYFRATSGVRKRLRVYGATRSEVHDKLVAAKTQAQQGIPVPDRNWRLGDYLGYWLENVIRANRRPSTYERYELTVRLYIRPALGSHMLSRLSVPVVQLFLNQKLDAGLSVRNVQIIREVLSSALTRAVREELVSRNVARLVELPTWQRREVVPWTATEARAFLAGAEGDALYPAFLILVTYGLRRGEVLGLRWCDVDFEQSTLRIRQQLQRIGGQLQQGPVKTRAGSRDLPLLEVVRQALAAKRPSGAADELVFRTSSGLPIEPRNFVRSFKRLCAQHDVRLIRIHDVRHTTATLLKNSGVPARDTQLILGHSTISITQEIYQHDDMTSRRASLERVEALFLRAPNSGRCRQLLPSKPISDDQKTTFVSGRGSRTRTYDTWFWRSTFARKNNPLTEALEVLEGHAKQWFLGHVAVKSSRQIFLAQPVRCPRELLTFLHAWLDYPNEEPTCSGY